MDNKRTISETQRACTGVRRKKKEKEKGKEKCQARGSGAETKLSMTFFERQLKLEARVPTR